MNFIIYGKSPQTITTTTEIEFLASADLVSAFGTRTTTGTLASIIPAAGKTFILLGSSLFPLSPGASNNKSADVEVQNDGVGVELLGISGIRGASASLQGGIGGGARGVVRGVNLIGDGVKIFRLEAVVVENALQFGGTLAGYLIDT